MYFLSREDVYLSVSLFGHNKRTRLLTADFPLYVQQELVFDKVLPRGVVGGGGYLIPLLHKYYSMRFEMSILNLLKK